MPGPMNPVHALRDEFWLVGREELQLRFGLNEKFLKTWMEAKEEERIPYILTGQRGPMFKPEDVWEWLKQNFGRGYVRKQPGIRPQASTVKTGKPGRPRLFAS